jgi:ribosomal protein L24
VGESVRIIQGHRAGEIGMVSRILTSADGLDSHVVVSMINDNTPTDLTVGISNLRIKHENDPNALAETNLI